MKYIYILFLVSFCSCSSLQYPNGFTFQYDGKATGLGTLIDIDGYYIVQRGCDSAFFSVFTFYPDGLFAIATTSKKPQELLDCFTSNTKSKLCQYVAWGTYRVEGNNIKTQTIRDEKIEKYVIFRDYEILPDKSIRNLSDYILTDKKMLIGYMKNYPSFFENECQKPSSFFKTDSLRDPQSCPFLKSKWFSATVK